MDTKPPPAREGFWASSWTTLKTMIFPFKERGEGGQELAHVSFWLAVFAGSGLVVAGWCGGASNWSGTALWALSFSAAGAAIGFLFGIPKVGRGESVVKNATGGYEQRVNTNLEDISDWLTKIIVGVTLVQFRDAVHAFEGMSRQMAADLVLRGGTTTAGALIAYFSVVGFFYGYLMTRLFLASAFRRADLSALGEEVDRLNREVNDLKAAVQEPVEVKQ